MTHNLEASSFLAEVNAFILEEILNREFEQIDINSVENSITDLFVELNWKLYAKFRKASTREFGLSLCFALIIENDLYFIRFGRLAGAQHFDNGLEIIGNNGRNVTPQTKEDLLLIGGFEGDIKVKVHKIILQENEYFLAGLLSEITEYSRNLSLKQISEKLKEDSPVFLIEPDNEISDTRKHRMKKFRIWLIASIMILLIVLSGIYVFFGKNWFAEQQHLLKTRNREFRQNELMETFYKLQIQGQETLNEIFQQNMYLEIFSHQKIRMEKVWTKNIPFSPKLKPVFDYKQIYLISDYTILTLKKKTQRESWEKTFSEKIINLELLDANRLLIILEDREIICLNRNSGGTIWTKSSEIEIDKAEDLKTAFQISLDKFKRLESSLIVLHSKNTITLLNTIEGDSIFTYKSDYKIDLISDFDLIERCIYIIENMRISKISIEVMS